MAINHKTKYALTAALGCLLLSGCQGNNPANWANSADWMPDGYRWADNTPISSPPKSAAWNQKTEDNSANSIRYDLTSTVKGVAADIAQSLDSQLMPGEKLFIAPRETITGLSNVFDLGLREAFIKRGYKLANMPEGAQRLLYSIVRDTDFASVGLDNPYAESDIIRVYKEEDAFLFVVDYEGASFNGGAKLPIKEFRLQALPKEDAEKIYKPKADSQFNFNN